MMKQVIFIIKILQNNNHYFQKRLISIFKTQKGEMNKKQIQKIIIRCHNNNNKIYHNQELF